MNSVSNIGGGGGGGGGRKGDALDPFEDLVAEEEDKNWKGICIAIFVILSIISCIATAIFILTPNDGGPRVKNPRLSLEDIISDQFQPEPFEGSWISDSEAVLKNSEGSLVIFDALINSSYVIVPNTTLRQFNVQKFSVSRDKKFALLVHDIKKVYERSFVAKYKIVNISNEHVISLEVGGVSGQDIQFASFGPKGNQLVVIHRNNIYYTVSVTDWPSNVKQLTQNGQEGVLFNGIPDWLYSDRIFAQSDQSQQSSAVWFSPEGTKLSFASFDDSKVSPISYPKYGSYDDPSNVYPSLVTLRYPLAGRDNPIVSVFVVDLQGNLDPRKVTPPSDVGRDHYFTSFSWIDEEKAAVIWMRREQNYSLVSLCSEDKSWNCEKHLQERLNGETPGWVEMFDAPLITSDKRYYLLRLPLNDADIGSFRQIAMITINGRVKNFLTQGHHDVTRILGHRTDLRTAFYIGTLDEKPGDRHIFSIPDIHSASARIPSCLTCNQTDRNCSFHDASFSHKSSYFILRCLGSGAPWTEIRSVEDNQIIMTSELDRNVESLMKERSFPQFRSLQIPLKGSKQVAEVSLILPPSLREYEFVRFPLVVQIMSDPGSQSVSSKLSVDWGLYLASKRDFIYARIDVRGSRYSGDKNLHEPWHRLGVVEVEDYLHVIDVLKADLHYVDPKRTAVWGWSYGAFVAASLISSERSNFNCAIAVAPITNWLFADSFTAERYFGHPWSSGNYIRYEKSDLIHKAINFRDRNLFIIHGTADDTVHLQNSFAFMKSLNDAGVIYKSQLYPDSNHNLDDVKYHFYKSMESFLLDSFKLSEDQDLVELQASLKSAPFEK